jgi:hypothetical protein
MDRFTEHQTLIAVGRFDAEVGRIRRDTIGNWLNERQLDVMSVLGSRADAAEVGQELQPFTITKCRNEIETNYGVSGVTAEKDINDMVAADLVEKAMVEDNRTKRDLRLSANGLMRWREYANRRAALIMAAAEAIQQLAPVSNPDFVQRKQDWIKGFLQRGAKSLFIGALALSMAFATAAEVRADTSATPSVQEVLYKFRNNADFLDRNLPKSLAGAPVFDAGISGQPLIWHTEYRQTVDGTDFLDRNLPKSLAGAPVFDAGISGQPLIWHTEYRQTVDGTDFLDRNLPKDFMEKVM